MINSPGYRARVNRLPIELSISMDLMEKKKKFENSDIFVHANMLNYTYISLAQMKDVIVCDEGKDRDMYQNKYICGIFLEHRFPDIKINTKNNLLIKL